MPSRPYVKLRDYQHFCRLGLPIFNLVSERAAMKMKNAIALCVVALAGTMTAQQPVSISLPGNNVSRTTTFSDQYCSGFINKDRIASKNMIGGGIDSPDTVRYNAGDFVFIMGENLKTGDKLSVIRELRDANRYETYKGQYHMLKNVGQPYADLGHVVILGHQNNAYIGKVEFSCDAILPGDELVPIMERAQVSYEVPTKFDRFPAPNKELGARIVMAKDFDFFIGNGQKVYLNVGSKDGVKVGDYFRVTRDFSANLSSEVDALSYKSPLGDDTQRVEPMVDVGHHIPYPGHPVIKVKDFPRLALGELVVLNVTPTSSTAMVTFALQDMHAGDTAEKISGPNSVAEQK